MSINKKRVLQLIQFISITTINLSGIANGIRHHETWLIILSSAGLALILAAGAIPLINSYRQKNKKVY